MPPSFSTISIAGASNDQNLQRSSPCNPKHSIENFTVNGFKEEDCSCPKCSETPCKSVARKACITGLRLENQVSIEISKLQSCNMLKLEILNPKLGFKLEIRNKVVFYHSQVFFSNFEFISEWL